MKDANGQMSIMMIDDNDVDRMIGKRLAERSGLVDRYIGFPSAQDALDHLSSADSPEYDIILLDQSMPNMDGLSFLREAKNRLHDRLSRTAVVMLTTILSDEDRASAESLGLVKRFLSKPLSAPKIEALQSV